MQQAGHGDVVDVRAVTGDEARVFLPLDRLPDEPEPRFQDLARLPRFLAADGRGFFVRFSPDSRFAAGQAEGDPDSWDQSSQLGGSPGKPNFSEEEAKFTDEVIIAAGDTWRYAKGKADFSTPSIGRNRRREGTGAGAMFRSRRPTKPGGLPVRVAPTQPFLDRC